LREFYKYELFNLARKKGWTVAPIAGSGGGRRGEHRPDALLADGNRRIVAELKKRKKLPVYLNYECDIEPILKYMAAFKAEGVIIAKIGREQARVFPLPTNIKEQAILRKTGKLLAIDPNNFEKGIPLEKYLTTKTEPTIHI
jgi:Holliday junction resolvase